MKTRTKTFLMGWLGLGAAGIAVWAGPLDETQIAKEAKWLAHVDMERLKESTVGGMALEQLKQQIEKGNASKISIDIDLLMDEIKSVTAYGTKFTADGDIDGVLVLKTGDRLQAIVDGFLASQEMSAGEEDELPFVRVEGSPYTTYLFDEELYVAYPEVGTVIASKRFEEIEQAFAVMEGQAPNLSAAEERLVLSPAGGFFFVATATGIHELRDMPPQARMLQKTKGGQLSLGEWGGEVRANLILTAESREVSLQLYRIVQGMVALASFTQVENQSLMDVVNRIEVTQEQSFVSVDFSYPIEALMELMGGLMQQPTEGNPDEARHGGHSSLAPGVFETSAPPCRFSLEMAKRLVAAHCEHG